MNAVAFDDAGTTSTSGAQFSGAPDSDSEWAGLTSATDSAELCRHWLALQCRQIGGTRAGLLLLKSAAGESYVPAAVWPDPQRDLAYLAGAAEEALAQRSGVVRPRAAAAGTAATVHIAYPVETEGELFGVVALDLSARSEADLRAALRQVLWGGAWLDALCLRSRSAQQGRAALRSALALGVLSVMQDERDLRHKEALEHPARRIVTDAFGGDAHFKDPEIENPDA